MATKVQTHMIKVALKHGNKELAIYQALGATMSVGNKETYSNGNVGYEVELASAYDLVKEEITRKEWAGYLASLSEKGLYKKQGDDCFGIVVFVQE